VAVCEKEEEEELECFEESLGNAKSI